MRVCLISGEYPPMQGGVGDYTRELGRALAAQGVEVCVVTSVRASRDNETGSVVVHPITRRWNWGCWAPIVAEAREHRADILHIQYQTAAYSMHPAINLLPLRLRWLPARPRTVVTFHDLRVPYLFPKAGPVRWWITLALARWSDAAVVTNVEDLATLRSQRLIRSSSVDLSLIPIGSNIAPCPPKDYGRQAWRRRWGVEPEETLLSYFGFLNESKGAETLIRALAELVRRGLSVRLLMVGGQVGNSDPTNVAYLRKMQRLIDELGLADRVLWTGFTPNEEVSANLLASDICVLPYRDGASFRRGSFMAALAHGLPIVSTRQTDNRGQRAASSEQATAQGQLIDGENVVLVPPDDPVTLADAVAALMTAPEKRRRLGTSARLLSQCFTWEQIAHQHLRIYDQ